MDYCDWENRILKMPKAGQREKVSWRPLDMERKWSEIQWISGLGGQCWDGIVMSNSWLEEGRLFWAAFGQKVLS